MICFRLNRWFRTKFKYKRRTKWACLPKKSRNKTGTLDYYEIEYNSIITTFFRMEINGTINYENMINISLVTIHGKSVRDRCRCWRKSAISWLGPWRCPQRYATRRQRFGSGHWSSKLETRPSPPIQSNSNLRSASGDAHQQNGLVWTMAGMTRVAESKTIAFWPKICWF